MLQNVKIRKTSSRKKSWQPLTKKFHGTEPFFRSSSPSQEIFALSETKQGITPFTKIRHLSLYRDRWIESMHSQSIFLIWIRILILFSNLLLGLQWSLSRIFPHRNSMGIFSFGPTDQSSSLSFPLLTSFQITCSRTHKKALSNLSQRVDSSSVEELLKFVCKD